MSTFTAFAFIFALLLIGRTLMHFRVLPETAPEVLNQVALYVCLPASVLLFASRLPLNGRWWVVALIAWLLCAISTLAVWLLARWLRWPDAVRGVLMLALALGNTAFLGYPLVQALRGDAALPYAVIYDQAGSFLILSTYGLIVLAWHAHGTAPGPRQIAGKVLRFPPFLALIVALTLMPAAPPAALELVLHRLADALLPLVALALGMQLKLALPREQRLPLAVGVLAKLLILPLLAWSLARFSGLHGDALGATVLEAAMPSMITAMALAASAGLAPELAAAIVGYGTVASALTLPLWNWLLL